MSSRPIRNQVQRLNLRGVMYFITTTTHRRRPIFDHANNVQLLRATMREAQKHYRFGMRGYVILPDHVHLLMQLKGDTDISKLMKSIKRNFTRNLKDRDGIKNTLTLWQHRFFDHVIRDKADFHTHLDYIHYNPVKHSLVTQPELYPHSSYEEYVKRGWYEIGWGHLDTPYQNDHNAEWGEF